MSQAYVCYQGEFYREDRPFMGLTRAFKYGDGVFETMRSFGKKVHLLELHFERLKNSLKALSIETDKEFYSELRSALVDTIVKNDCLNGCRLRLTVFRAAAGKYLPKSNQAAYLIEAEAIENKFELNSVGLKIEIAESIQITPNPFSNLKSISSQPYIIAALENEQRGSDDLLILNTKNQIVEACHSNVFLRVGKKIYTPPLSSACISGVMRAYLLSQIPTLGYSIEEKDLYVKDLVDADEVFLSNSAQGLKWVGSYGKKRYFKNFSQSFIESLNKNLS